MSRSQTPALSFARWRARIVTAVALAFAAVTARADLAAALCGDLTGDGYVTATDALTALRLAVTSQYDALADTFPLEAFDAQLTTSDARVVLAHAAARAVPVCAAAPRTVIVTTASCDFVTGGVAEIDVATREVLAHRPGGTAADAVIRRRAGRVFVLNRFGANTIVELDAAGGLAPLWECSVGKGANPHDLAIVAGDKAYVTRYDATSLSVVDPTKGPGGCIGFVRDAIDLAPFADDDGFPEMDQMALVGSTLWVVLQRLDRNSFFRPRTHGVVVAIDTETDAVVDTIDLAIQNPFAETKGLYFDPRSGFLWVAGPGRLFTDLDDGGIELIDPASRTSLGVIATGADLGGDLTDLAVVGSSRAYALVAGEGFKVSLVEIDVDAPAVADVLVTSDDLLSDVELTETGELWVADRNCFDPGLRVFTITDNAEVTGEPLNPGLAPFTIGVASR